MVTVSVMITRSRQAIPSKITILSMSASTATAVVLLSPALLTSLKSTAMPEAKPISKQTLLPAAPSAEFQPPADPTTPSSQTDWWVIGRWMNPQPVLPRLTEAIPQEMDTP